MDRIFGRMSFLRLRRMMDALIALFAMLCGLLVALPLHIYLEPARKGGTLGFVIAAWLVVSIAVFSLTYRFGLLRLLHRIGGSNGSD